VLTMPGAIGRALSCVPQIQQIAKQLVLSHSVLFLGRDLLYPLALEGALKLKEISYLHAEGFAAGEMKHGPIALIEPGLPVIGLVSQDALQAKTISNLREAEARGADLYLISCGAAGEQVDFARQIVEMPACNPLLAPLLLAIPAQILAWQAALEKGTDVDQPRNLAKSVTVE
jgi:glucosamine--fructose-6-phosphate aminotransferase (isomerizing)